VVCLVRTFQYTISFQKYLSPQLAQPQLILRAKLLLSLLVLIFEALHGGLEFFLSAEQLLFNPDQREAHDDGRDDRGHK